MFFFGNCEFQGCFYTIKSYAALELLYVLIISISAILYNYTEGVSLVLRYRFCSFTKTQMSSPLIKTKPISIESFFILRKNIYLALSKHLKNFI